MPLLPENISKKISYHFPFKMKRMTLVLFPVGTSGYQLGRPAARLADLVVEAFQNRAECVTYLERENIQISAHDWLFGHFEEKFAQQQTALCAFHQNRLAHVVWASASAEAGRRLTWDPPVVLNWETSSILSAAYTPDEFRGQRIFPFMLSEAAQYVQQLGFQNAYGAYGSDNIASKKGLQKVNGQKIATCLRARIKIPKVRVISLAVLTWGQRSDGSRWYRRKFHELPDLHYIPLA
ncbi:MAG: hypothetical protein JW862_17755 [Anaerolineales bacterium]|nr:hypothetical protein [Anaerolineales bacterium]